MAPTFRSGMNLGRITVGLSRSTADEITAQLEEDSHQPGNTQFHEII